MRLSGAGLLLRGLLLSISMPSPAVAIELDISDERMLQLVFDSMSIETDVFN